LSISSNSPPKPHKQSMISLLRITSIELESPRSRLAPLPSAPRRMFFYISQSPSSQNICFFREITLLSNAGNLFSCGIELEGWKK
jgi:hypothetical protein